MGLCLGSLMGAITSTIACCCCSAAAQCCCACLPSCTSSIAARLMYLLMFMCGFILSIVIFASDPRTWMNRFSSLCQKSNHTILMQNFNINCLNTANFSAIYRTYFAMSVYFFLFSLIMIRVKSSREIRAKINNGFWIFKFILFFGTVAACVLLIPEMYFAVSWQIIGMICSFLFIVIQFILILDFSYAWNEAWVIKYETTQVIFYYYGLITFTALCYFIILGSIFLLIFIYGTNSSCHLTRFFILFNAVLCIIINILAVLPVIQKYTPRSGLLQASIISVYIMFLTWSGISSYPSYICNTFLDKMHLNISTLDTKAGLISRSSLISVSPDIHNSFFNLESTAVMIFTLIIFLITIIYFCLRKSSDENSADNVTAPAVTPVNVQVEDREAAVAPTAGGETVMPTSSGTASTAAPVSVGTNDGNKSKGQVVVQDEEHGVQYDYSLFHFVMCIGSAHLMMTQTNWYSLTVDSQMLTLHKAPVWVKISASWLCFMLYLWTLVAPALFPGRDFN